METDASALDWGADSYGAGQADPSLAALTVQPALAPAEPPPAVFPPGSIWDGRYRVAKLIGEGGMGNVLLADDLAKGDAQVALKVLQPKNRAFATPYFMREYVIQREVRHPCIARAYAIGFDAQSGEEVPYFTMPFVPGVTLADLMLEALPLDAVWRWMIELLEALDAIHRAGYLHRDIKPGNILIDRGADGAEARLIDFGIATALDADCEDFFIGTPAYSAPERMECLPFDVRSDLYSVGLLIFEVIEGAQPWPGDDPEELFYRRCKTPVPQITNKGCPPALRALVAELLDPSPDNRPASAAAVIDRIQTALGMQRPLESTSAFAERLRGLPVPSASYASVLEVEGEVVVVHVPEGHAISELLDRIGDRHSLGGARVVQVRLQGKPGGPMHELEGALDVFRRLRASRGENIALLKGMAGAATMLTRLHRKTVMVIEGLENADEATLMVLGQAFVGAHNSNLTVIASVATERPAKAPRALAAFQAQGFVTHVSLEPLTTPETSRYLANMLGGCDVPTATLEALVTESEGRPTAIQQFLIDAFDHGALIRHDEGYEWLVAPSRDEVARLLDDELTVPDDGAFDGLLADDELAGVLAASQPERAMEAIADRLVLVGKGAEAAPFLARAARVARTEGRIGEAEELMARALALVADEEDAGAAVDTKLAVLSAALDQARALGADESIVEAADQLLAAAVEAAHLPSIERALAAHIDQAEQLWDVARATASVDRILLFQESCGAPQTSSLKSWARGLAAALAGDVAQVFEATSSGLEESETEAKSMRGDQSSLGRWARAKLLGLRAEVAVRAGLVAVAPRAIDLFENSALNEDPFLPTGGHAARLQVQLLRALWLRRCGDFNGARTALASYESVPGAEGDTPPPDRRRRAALEVELAACDLALGRCDEAIRRAGEAIKLAEIERSVAVAFEAEGLLAEAYTRKGQPERQFKRIERILSAPPAQVPAHVMLELKQRWLNARLGRGEGETLAADAAALAREAGRCRDFGALGRASFVAAQAALRAKRPLDALRHAESLAEIVRKSPVGGPPKHAVEWLLASVHYQLKWFKSASKLAERAMESLRSATVASVDQRDRADWIASGDNLLIGLFR